MTPKFLNFKLANSSMKYSRTYKECQTLLLKEEIKEKKSIIYRQNKEFKMLEKTIKSKVSIFDFSHISCLFLVGNDIKLAKVKQVHHKKLFALGLRDQVPSNDPDKVIFNFSSHVLTDLEKKVLAKGLNFTLPPVKLNYADYFTPYEL